MIKIAVVSFLGAGVLFLIGYAAWRGRRKAGVGEPEGVATRPQAAKAPSGPVPEWAGPMEEKDFERFLERVGDHFRKKNMPIEINVELGEVIVHHEIYEGARIGLFNLAAICRQIAPGRWAEVIKEHLGAWETGRAEMAELSGKKKDFDRVRDLIHIRIYERGYIEEVGAANVAFREDLPGTVSVLVYDLATTIQTVNSDDVKAWGRDAAEVFRLGFRNVRERYRAEITDQETSDGVVIKVIAGEHFYNATHALLIEHYPGLLGKFGALIGIPNRGALLVYPVSTLETVQAVKILMPAILGMHRDGPGPISDKLYWYHEGVYRELPYRIEGNSLSFTPPDEFVEILNGMGEG